MTHPRADTDTLLAMSTGQQVILALLLMLGNPIMISIFTLVFSPCRPFALADSR